MVITMRRIFTVIFIFAIMAYSLSSTSYAQCPPAYTFTGEAAGDHLGSSVSGAGDVDNDGFADLIVGAHGNDAGGSSAGRAYVYSGQTGALLYTFTGEAANDGLGRSVSGAGDVNNDGYADLIVGAYRNDSGGTEAGRAYVYSGKDGALLHTFTGEGTYDWFGTSAAGAGDVDNDGFPDLVVGAPGGESPGSYPGKAYVYSGQTGALIHTFTGEAAFDRFGMSVSGAGDVNKDGFADLIVGAYQNDAGGFNAGRAYVYSGLDATVLHIFTGESSPYLLGQSVSEAGDVNNDGFPDVIIGAHGGDSYTGLAYVYSGKDWALLHAFTGEATGDWLGHSVSGAGDVDTDGFADLIVGGHGVDAGGVNTGRAYVYSGQTGTLLNTFTGEATLDAFGYIVSGAGDVNNDGHADLIVGAHSNDAGGNRAGRAYVFTCGSLCSGFDGLFCDDFEDGNDDGWLGSPTGSWTVVDGVYDVTLDTPESISWRLTGNEDWGDIRLSLDFNNLIGRDKLFYLRWGVGGTNGYLVRIRSNYGGFTEGNIVIHKYIDNVSVEHFAYAVVTESNQWYRIDFDMVGNTITCYLDDIEAFSYTDTQALYPSGRFGFAANKNAGDGTSHVQFDNVVVICGDGATCLPFANVTGNITDASTSLPLDATQVYLLQDAVVQYERMTNSEGEFAFLGINAGSYDISVSKDGYLPQLIENHEFVAWENHELPLQLEPYIPFCTNFAGLFCDDFEDGTDDGWSHPSPNCTWSVANGEYSTSLSGDRVWCISSAGDPSWNNYILEADVKGTAGVDKVLLFRFQDENNFYAVNLRSDWNGLDELTIDKMEGGVYNADIVSVPHPSQNDQWYHLKVAVEEDVLSVWVDDYNVTNWRDPSNPFYTGKIAIAGWTGEAGLTTVYYDNIRVSSAHTLSCEIQDLQEDFWALLGHAEDLVVSVTNELGQPVPGSRLQSITTTFSGSTPAVTLYDDGLHNDGAADDGVYGSTFTPADLGSLTMTVTAVHATYGESSDSRSGTVYNGVSTAELRTKLEALKDTVREHIQRTVSMAARFGGEGFYKIYQPNWERGLEFLGDIAWATGDYEAHILAVIANHVAGIQGSTEILAGKLVWYAMELNESGLLLQYAETMDAGTFAGKSLEDIQASLLLLYYGGTSIVCDIADRTFSDLLTFLGELDDRLSTMRIPEYVPEICNLEKVIEEINRVESAFIEATPSNSGATPAIERQVTWKLPRPGTCDLTEQDNFIIGSSNTVCAAYTEELADLEHNDKCGNAVSMGCKVAGVGLVATKIVTGLVTAGAALPFWNAVGFFAGSICLVADGTRGIVEMRGKYELGTYVLELGSSWSDDVARDYAYFDIICEDIQGLMDDPRPGPCSQSVELLSVNSPDICYGSGENGGSQYAYIYLRNHDQDQNAKFMVVMEVLKKNIWGNEELVAVFYVSPHTIAPGQDKLALLNYTAAPSSWFGLGNHYITRFRVLTSGQDYEAESRFKCVTLEQCIFLGSSDNEGTILQSFAQEAEEIPSVYQATEGSVRSEVRMSFPGSDFDLHVYDGLGNHVGHNYLTEEDEVQIAGASYSGHSSNPEVVEFPNSGGNTYQIVVKAVSVIDSEFVSVIFFEEGEHPAILGVIGESMELSAFQGDSVDFQLPLIEIGGQQPVNDVLLTVGELNDSVGHVIPSSSLGFVAPPATIPPGTIVSIEGYIVVPIGTDTGAYFGQISVSSSGGSFDIRVTVKVLSCDCTDFCDLDGAAGLSPVDVVYIVNYVYRQLDARPVLSGCSTENGDWDCSGSVNPVDVVYYVNYVYKSVGSGPCDPCEQ